MSISSNNDLLVHKPTRITILGLLWQVPTAAWILEMALGIECWLSTTKQLTKRCEARGNKVSLDENDLRDPER